MTNEQTNFTIHNGYGLANSSISSTSTGSLCDSSYSVHFAGSKSSRLLEINPFWHHYLEVIAKLKVIQASIRPPYKGVSYG